MTDPRIGTRLEFVFYSDRSRWVNECLFFSRGFSGKGESVRVVQQSIKDRVAWVRRDTHARIGIPLRKTDSGASVTHTWKT